MQKKCVFKCQFNGKWFYVYEVPHPDLSKVTYYQTYVGRKRLDHYYWSCLGSAIGSILSVLDDSVIIDLVQVWK